MAIFKSITEQFGQFVNSQSIARRVMLLGIVLGSVAGLVWLMLYAQTGGYAVLYTGMQPSEAGEAVVKLRQLGIPVRLENGGTTIKVPEARADEASVALAMEGIPNSGTVGYEMMDKSSLGQSKFQQEKNYIRMREGELSRTLQSIEEIERARVHLALPEGTLFVKDEQVPTASVVLKLRRGRKLRSRQLSGIVHLVSHGIEGLRTENVSIIDQYGNLLSDDETLKTATVGSAQSGYKLNYEDVMKSRIESMLENFVGKGRVVARVQADFDFATLHRVRETYNPDDQEPIVRTEQKSIERRPGETGGAASGAVGTASNLPMTGSVGAQSSDAEPAEASRLDQTVNYAVSRTYEEQTLNAPTPERLTVAVLVDYIEEETTGVDGETATDYRERTQQELMQIEDLVKATIGYVSDDTRQDLVTVKCAPFKIEELGETETSGLSYDMRRMIEMGIRWGIFGGVALLLILMVLRPAIKQILVVPMEPAGARAALAGAGAPAGALPDDGEGESGGARLAGGAAAQLGETPGSAAHAGGAQPQEQGRGSSENKSAKQNLARMQKKMATEQAKFNKAAAEEIHNEVRKSAKENPGQTVSLLRQWMEEA